MPTAHAINEQLHKAGLRIESEYGAAPYREDWPNSHGYLVTLRFRRRVFRTPFYMGEALTHEPTAADVLSSLIQDFCFNCGYDSDIRKAHATYEQCRQIATGLKRFLRDDFARISEMVEDY